ncbi:hypothetical protein D3C81_2026710 [compost metagenome]
MAGEQGHDFAAQPSPLRGLAVLFPQALEQCRFVAALPERRQLEGQAADAVVQVLAKTS